MTQREIKARRKIRKARGTAIRATQRFNDLAEAFNDFCQTYSLMLLFIPPEPPPAGWFCVNTYPRFHAQ